MAYVAICGTTKKSHYVQPSTEPHYETRTIEGTFYHGDGEFRGTVSSHKLYSTVLASGRCLTVWELPQGYTYTSHDIPVNDLSGFYYGSFPFTGNNIALVNATVIDCTESSAVFVSMNKSDKESNGTFTYEVLVN